MKTKNRMRIMNLLIVIFFIAFLIKIRNYSLVKDLLMWLV